MALQVVLAQPARRALRVLLVKQVPQDPLAQQVLLAEPVLPEQQEL